MTWQFVSEVSFLLTSRRSSSACTVHRQSRYRFIESAVSSNPKLCHWTRLIDRQRLFVSAVPIMATDVNPSYSGRLACCGVALLILTDMQVEVVGLLPIHVISFPSNEPSLLAIILRYNLIRTDLGNISLHESASLQASRAIQQFTVYRDCIFCAAYMHACIQHSSHLLQLR
jgi:hypothetical protein